MITSCHGNYSNPFSSLPEGANRTRNEPNGFFRNLSQILPSYKKEFPKALVEYSVLLMALIQTIEFLESGDIKKFDALVCETLCQIRAVINCINFQDCLESLLKIKTQVESILEKIKKLLDSSPTNHFDLKTFLENENLNIYLSASEILFVECFLLTIVKVQTDDVKRPEITDIKFLKNLAPEEKWVGFIKDNFGKNLINKIRGEVSRISAPFLRYLACEQGDQTSLEMLAQKNIILIRGRECPPTYWTTKVLVQAILDRRIPVVLWIKQKNELNKLIKEFCLYYKSDPSKNIFKKKSPYLIDAKKPVIVMEADCCRKKGILPDKENSITEVEPYNLADLIKAFAADHPQYPGSNEDIHFESSLDTTYHDYKKKAIEWKCTRDDPRLLHIRHIYCDRLENVKPIKYEINSYLEAVYGDFYREFDCKKIKEFARKANIDLDVFVEGKKLVIYIKEPDDLLDLKYGGDRPSSFEFFPPVPFLHQIPIVFEITTDRIKGDIKVTKSPFDHLARVELEEKNWFGFNLLHLAIEHDNPVKFLTDHKSYWGWYSLEITSYLIAKLQNFEEPAFMNILSDSLSSPLHIFGVSELKSIINSVSEAIDSDSPEIKARAIDLLLVAGSEYSYSLGPLYYYSIFQRSLARKALKKVLHEDQIRTSFQEMLNNESHVQLRIELLNMLGPIDISDNFDKLEKGQIVENLCLTWNFQYFKNDKAIGLIKEIAIVELLGLILSDKHEKSLRIAAVRYLCNYFISITEQIYRFIPESVSYIDNASDYDYNFVLEQKEYRKIISLFLKELIQNEAIDEAIRTEASSLLAMIVTHLKIPVDEYPCFEIREEIPKLLNWIARESKLSVCNILLPSLSQAHDKIKKSFMLKFP